MAPNTSYKRPDGLGNWARGASGNLVCLRIPRSPVDLGGRVPPNNPGFPPPDPVRPGAAPVVTHSPSTPKPRSQGGKWPGGGPEGGGGQGLQAQWKWTVGGTQPSLHIERKSTWAASLRVFRASTHSFPAGGPFPVSFLWAGTTLNPAALLGAWTCSSLSGKNLGLELE